MSSTTESVSTGGEAALTIRETTSKAELMAGAPTPAPAATEASATPSDWADYIKSIVFGGLDGIVTTFAIIASVEGASFPIEVVILTGFAKLLGDGLSMGLGDCISEQAEQAHILGEKKREEWEFENHPAGERSEMVEIYKQKGLSDADATRLIDIITAKPEYKDFFIQHMVTHELGLQIPGEDDNPVKDGAVTFLSFMFWGSIPLWAYVIYYGAKWENKDGQFGICIALTVICLYGLGCMQAHILQQKMWKQGLGMVLNGGLAAGAAYLIGWGLQHAVSDGESTCL